jgi:hypothetical protein
MKPRCHLANLLDMIALPTAELNVIIFIELLQRKQP